MDDGGAPQGIRVEAVTAWLDAHVAGARSPYSFSLIAGGRSNLTYIVTDSTGRRLVLRRPPLSHALASAHDMGREHRIIAALRDTRVPVPDALGLCTDEEVNGAPFYLMEFVDGHVIRDQDAAIHLLSEPARTAASHALVDTLAEIHRVDPGAVGLGELGRHEGYVARQLKRWYGQWNASKTRELPDIDVVHEELSRRIPDQGAATIVHGDFRLDNCIVGDDGSVRAVLDWELCTLGDPLADVGLLMVYWTGPNDDTTVRPFSGTQTLGFLDRRDIAARYAATSGRDISQIDFYVAFAYWKLACIMEGVFARYRAGAMGATDEESLRLFSEQVELSAQQARVTLARLV
ncbi:MAG: phosphotransferase family protein [Ilumatobacteraceae bacterium]